MNIINIFKYSLSTIISTLVITSVAFIALVGLSMVFPFNNTGVALNTDMKFANLIGFIEGAVLVFMCIFWKKYFN